MDLGVRHHWYEHPRLIKTYQIGDPPPQVASVLPNNLTKSKKGLLISNLTLQKDEAHILVYCTLIALLGILLLIGVAEAGWIHVSANHFQEPFTQRYIPLLYLVIAGIVFYLSMLKLICENRYLIFHGQHCFVMTKKCGVWPILLSDLKFHVIKTELYGDRYFLEVEIPETSFLEKNRMVILEVTVDRITMDGILAVLLPLLNGDDKPYLAAKKRKYIPLPHDQKPGLWRKYTHLESHFHVWFITYKINQFVFWLLHGDRKRALRKQLEGVPP